VRWSLFSQIVLLSWDTLRANPLRSALTVLGVVIGVTSIVGITALVRGLDESFRDLFREIGPNTIYVQRFSFTSEASGVTWAQIMRRPNLTPGDADAIRRAPSVQAVDVSFGGPGGGGGGRLRLTYRGQRTKPIPVTGTTERWPAVMQVTAEQGRFFTAAEVQRRQNVVVLGQTALQALFPAEDPLGKTVRLGLVPYTVVGVLAKRPSPGLFDSGPDDIVVIPHTAYQKQYGIRANLLARGETRPIQIAVVPREGVSREQVMAEVEETMRIRHRLQLHEPNDFDLLTQDAALAAWERITQATFLALVVLSSIALMVGGIGVMAIMTISVTERTREIGVRKALGARRREVLWQFLLEAMFLTSAGGLLGIAFGTAIGLGVHVLTGFPVSLPWWSFAIGIGFSAGVGVLFGMLPAIRAARLDPIEALRYE
jgi:putative ABC transport system permease protein